ncbi:MAG: class II fructose-bisphosphate aldolase [Erysipelotrichaceae bacterium]
MEQNLVDAYHLAVDHHYALGAFNVFNMLTAEAVVQASNEMRVPAIIQMSASTVKYLGVKKALMLFDAVLTNAQQNIMLHLDHCTDVELAKECIDAGWKSIMFDGSHLPLDENIRLTKELVEYGKGKNVLVEGEVGVILGVDDGISSDHAISATFDEVARYFKETGVSTIAPSIGTAHGLYKGSFEINYDLIQQLINHHIEPVVVHGGTGLGEDIFKKLVSLKVAKINVSTALKHAYLDAMKNLTSSDLVYEPVVYDKKIIEAVKQVVLEHMRYFNGSNENAPS